VNLDVDDPEEKTILYILFESSNFREGWQGVIESGCYTRNASLFLSAFVSIGAPNTAAAEADKRAAKFYFSSPGKEIQWK
jgi:hypothetical protein